MLKWFNTFNTTANHTFIMFDIIEFYPSISAQLLNDALDFAEQYTFISQEDRRIILHTKESVLVHKGEHWSKTASSTLFDITMGSYDGAESCELVGTYLLSKITKKLGPNFGLYRDDGLALVNSTPRQTELIKKDLCTLFRNHELRITIEANKRNVNFLDVNLDLNTGKTTPYTKPNHSPQYINTQSNHPPSILKKHSTSYKQKTSYHSIRQPIL
jgi:hypothetical protein